MKSKQKVITEKEARVAANILCEYIFSHNNKGYQQDFVEHIKKEYNLYDDPENMATIYSGFISIPQKYCKVIYI